MKQPVHFQRKLLASAIGLAMASGMTNTVLADSPPNDELWRKIEQQQRMIEQQQRMIEELRSRMGQTEQLTNQHQEQIDQAAREMKTAVEEVKTKDSAGEQWMSYGDGKPYVDKLSLQGGWTWYIPDDDASTYFLECIDCGDTSNIAGYENYEHQHELNNFSGGIKWTREFDTYDYGFAVHGYVFETDKNTSGAVESSSNELGTPYGTCDSSSSGDKCDNEDSAMFLTGDFEYGWRRSNGPLNSSMRYFVGVRATYHEWERDASQELSSSEIYAGEEQSTFWGIGPRIGVSFEKPLSASKNLSLFGGISGGVLLGQLERDWDLNSETDDIGGYNDEDKFTVVPFGDFEGGLGYAVEKDIQLQIGYHVGYQHDVLHTSTVCTDDNDDDTKGGGNPSCDDEDSAVLYHGPFLRINAYF